MKIEISKISQDGLILEDDISASMLEMDEELIKFPKPIHARASVYKITNTVSVDLTLGASIIFSCSRCLEEFTVDLDKHLKLNYLVNKNDIYIDLNPDIREEIILDFPIKPLCKKDCKGLCPKCGKDLNKGGCSCGST